MQFDVVIVGAGAAGLVAAYLLSKEKPQLNIVLLEKEETAGRKLKASGNGKCNLTNREFTTSCYHSHNASFVGNFVDSHTSLQMVFLFEEMGIKLYEQNGYYYPVSNQAKQVVRLLVKRCESNGVKFKFCHVVNRIEKQADGSFVTTANNSDGQETMFYSRYVILAAGGAAAPQLGGSDAGLQIARRLRHKVYKPVPRLCPIYIKDANIRLAKGVRLDAVVTVHNKNGSAEWERGQVQFNEDNLSGIVIMNLSGYFHAWLQAGELESLYLDTLPELEVDELREFLTKQRASYAKETAADCLAGLLPDGFVSYILKRCRLKKDTELSALKDKDLNRITSAIKKLTFEGEYREDFERAQVTGGGVDVCGINAKNFESLKCKRLYLIGELLDVDGKCGGYNLTFAMLGALDAAISILSETEGE